MKNEQEKDLTFSSLVRAIDEKHGSTYIEPSEAPKLSPELSEQLELFSDHTDE
jgi:hypothetical protein